jgi:hypothetical protein
MRNHRRRWPKKGEEKYYKGCRMKKIGMREIKTIRIKRP